MLMMGITFGENFDDLACKHSVVAVKVRIKSF